MTDRIWKGGTSSYLNDFATATNWVDPSGNTGVPADGDTLIFSSLANKDSNGNHYACIAASGDGWDQSAKDFPLILGYPGFNGGLGLVSGSYFYGLACAAGKIIWMSECDAYINGKHASAKLDTVIMDSPGHTLYVAKAASNGIALDYGYCFQGTLHLCPPEDGQTDIINPDADTLLEANGSTAIIIYGMRADLSSNEVAAIKTYDDGIIYIDHPWTAAYAYGGKIYYGEIDDSQIPSTAQTSGNLSLLGGDMDWYMRSTIKGLDGRAGSLVAKGGCAKTLGDSSVSSGTMVLYAAEVDLSQSGGKVTLGTDCEIQQISSRALFKGQYQTQVIYSQL